MTFRLRLTLWYSVLLMAIVALFGAAVFIVLQRTMHDQVDATLEEIVDDIRQDLQGYAFVGRDGQPTLFTPTYPQLGSFRTPGVYVQLWPRNASSPFNLSANLTAFRTPLDPAALDSTEPVRRNVTIENTELRVITYPLRTQDGFIVGHIQAAQSVETVNAATQQLLKIMLLGSAIALVASLLLGDWLARRAMRPIASITRTAEQIIKAEDLDSRIPYNGPQDELGYLITTLNEMIARLERLFTSQQRFVADVSHELRTPLTAIQSHLDLIERMGLAQGDQDPSLKAVKSEVQRMTRLVGDLLTLAQADLGYLPFVEGEVELDTLLLEVFNQAKVLSQDAINVKLADIDQVVVCGDSDRLKQLLLNLVTNAIKYTPAGGNVTLSLQQRGAWASISVADTGIGIPPEDIPHIFDRFYRVDKARDRTRGGAGLGLAIARWIADAHNGKLSVKSEVGQGTTFTLKLPIKGTPPAQEQHLKDTRPRFPLLRLRRDEESTEDDTRLPRPS